MKHLFKNGLCLLALCLILFANCKKDNSCEGCINGNRPPIALAGPDQVITIPTDSTILDGSLSADPDGSIRTWNWSKVSGPASMSISNSAIMRTLVKNLVVGTYLFELKVTDDKGATDTDTMQVIVGPGGTNNRPPVAKAGIDQTISLPVNSVNLDGRASTDPDNDISTYRWKRITGLSNSSLIIATPNLVQTQVWNFEQGVYEFELTVTDATGLFSRDTIKVTVNDPAQPPPCDNSNRPIINMQVIPVGTFSISRSEMAVASAGSKIVFAGGRGFSPNCTDCLGSKRVDIYDTLTQQWSTAELSTGRFGIAAVAAGNKIFFAGGENGDGAFDILYSTVDIYDVTNNTWSVTSLSEPRSYIAAAAAGNKVVFAGGASVDMNWFPATAKVDIYDLTTNGWSTATLSEARGFITPVAVNQKIYFAGGNKNSSTSILSDKIDIYDAATQSWSTSFLMKPMAYQAGIEAAGKIYWAFDCDVEIRNIANGSSTSAQLYAPWGQWVINHAENAFRKDNKIIFPRGNKFDIYDIINNTWSIGVFPEGIHGELSMSVNNTIYMFSHTDGQVWKLVF